MSHRHVSHRPVIVIVGGGPTAVYALLHLIKRAPVPLAIRICEREATIGPGMPYREGINTAAMLANIEGREVPPVTRDLVTFLRECDGDALAAMGVDRAAITEEAFFPRLVLGSFYQAELAETIARGRGLGHEIEVLTRTRVRDIRPTADGIRVDWTRSGEAGGILADHVVLATGHVWPEQRTPDGVTLHAPWPAERMAALRGQRVGVLGSSLSAIDVAVALAGIHGQFVPTDEGLEWVPDGDPGDFGIEMFSRRGLLPEADWYYPLPLPDLPRFTPDAVAAEVRRGADGLLDRTVALFAADLRELDPAYAGQVAPETVEGFAERYFAERMAHDSWDWARANLAEAECNRETHHAVPWRVALLRAHEVFEEVTPHLSEEDLDRFHHHMRGVFADAYAGVPHESVRRLLALRAAGRLNVTALGDDAEISAEDRRVAIVATDGRRHIVDALVDARGQRPATVADLGFASLAELGEDTEMGDTFALSLPTGTRGSIFCLSLPVLLRRHPFVQGLTSAALLGDTAAEQIAQELTPRTRAA